MKRSVFKEFGCISWASFIGGLLLFLTGILFIISSILIQADPEMTTPSIFMLIAGIACIGMAFVMKNWRVG